MITCPVCNSYLLTLRQASGRGDEEQFEAVKAIYLLHLQTHEIMKPEPAAKVNRDLVREAFGRMGE